MSKNNIKNNSPGSSNVGSHTATAVSTQVPGVDMTQVIVFPPHLVKENSAKVDVKAMNGSRRK